MPPRFLPGTHLSAALAWSRDEAVDWRTITIAALGMTAPVVVGLAFGQLELGFTIGLGAMLLAGGAGASDTTAQEQPSPGSAVLPALLAVAAATAIAGSRWTDAVMIALSTAAAAVIG